MTRHDWKRAVQAVIDFRTDNKRPQVMIEKFSPGEHFYVGREKFASRDEAATYAERNGYRVLPGVKITSMNDLILAAINKRGR